MKMMPIINHRYFKSQVFYFEFLIFTKTCKTAQSYKRFHQIGDDFLNPIWFL
jgi:hypothetical protein